MWDDELDEQRPLEWLIEGILPASALVVLYGHPGTGKSFIAIDWAFSVATGQPWCGHRVSMGNVIYVCAEGWQGMKARVASWKSHRNLTGFDRTGVGFLGRALRLLDPRDVELFAQSIQQQSKTIPKMIVIDTLARNSVGLDENSAIHMGQIVSSCDLLRERFGCTVVLLHHSTKSHEHGPSVRGHGSLKAAVDTVALVTETKEDLVRLYCEKQKDASKFSTMFFKMVPVGKSVILTKTDPVKKKQKSKDEPPDDQYPDPELAL